MTYLLKRNFQMRKIYTVLMFHFKFITMFNRILIIVSLHVSSIIFIIQDEKYVLKTELFLFFF